MASPSIVPDDPLALARTWLDEAAGQSTRNPWAMALATTGTDGRPACRYVLLKALDGARGFVVFYTNYGSRKARELDRSGCAAAAMYWPVSGRQLRFEGRITRLPAAESDAYFDTRPRASQLNAWSSSQSNPLPSHGLEPALARMEARFPPTTAVPRPEIWGGYRLWLDAVEFWTEGEARFHERIRFLRSLDGDARTGYAGGQWTHVRLQP